MEDNILDTLKNSTKHGSKEFLSTSLDVSRTSLCKHVESPKKKGYIIENISHKCYNISCYDKINKHDLFSALQTKEIGRTFIHFDLIDSTNSKGKELAKKNFPNGTIVVAEEQYMANGRFKRSWNSPKGGIWFTIILRPNIPTSEAPKITQIAAACIYKSLKELNIHSKIKWPNDIHLNGKKLCGILGEMSCDMDAINYLIIGIGMNINVDIKSLDKDVQNTATSLRNEYNIKFDRNEILAKFLNNFEIEYEKFSKDLNLDNTIRICRENSNIWGKKAKLITYTNEEIVTCLSLSDQGDLIVQDSNGNKKIVLSGEISFKLN